MTEKKGSACMSIAPQIVWRDVEGDLVLFDERSEEYHTLNASASFVWRRIAQGCTIEAIIGEASVSCPERADMIARDVQTFVTAATELKLLEA
ncbi:MAG: PqqD family protein [Sphingomonas sp.]